MKEVTRKDLPSDYDEMMKTEQHHQHDIIIDENGTIRWKEDPFIRQFTKDCSLNHIVMGFLSNENDKNTESYRELYRKMGYSLSGYWEVFYWDMNNDEADDYEPPKE